MAGKEVKKGKGIEKKKKQLRFRENGQKETKCHKSSHRPEEFPEENYAIMCDNIQCAFLLVEIANYKNFRYTIEYNKYRRHNYK